MGEPFTLRAPPSITRPTAYYFRFEQEGWAIFTLNDDTCEFSIQSDWGVYGYRWHQTGLGERTLTEFIAKGDCHYLVNKLKLGTQSKDLDRVVDAEATMRAIRESICTSRRTGSISKLCARELWEHADDWHSDAFQYAACNPELDAFLEPAFEYIGTRPSDLFIFLRDRLLPFFCQWLRDNVIVKQAEADHG